jgi:hypothetical protein
MNWSRIMRIVEVIAAIFVFVGWMFIIVTGLFVVYEEGQRSVRGATVVRSGTPYYRGGHFGQCAHADGVEFCATDQPEDP